RAVRLAAERGVRVCLDVNYRAKLWNREDAAAGLRPLLPYVNVLVASEDELPLVAESPEAALAAGPGEVVVKLGGDGAEVWTAGGSGRGVGRCAGPLCRCRWSTRSGPVTLSWPGICRGCSTGCR